MKKLTLVAIVFLILFSQCTHVFASEGSSGSINVIDVPSSTPLFWEFILKILCIVIPLIPGLASLSKLASKFLRWLYWRTKHGKSKTPVVILLTVKFTFLYERLYKVLG